MGSVEDLEQWEICIQALTFIRITKEPNILINGYFLENVENKM